MTFVLQETTENRRSDQGPEIRLKIPDFNRANPMVPGDYPGHMHTNALQTRAKSVHYKSEADMVEMWEIVPGT